MSPHHTAHRRPRRTLRRLAAVAAAALAVGLLADVAPAAAAATGTIVVDVTGADTGQAVVGVCAEVFRLDVEFNAFDCTDQGESGPLVITGLEDGVAYQFVLKVPQATAYFPVVGGRQVTAPADLSFTLERGVFVEGTLSYQDGSRPDSAQVFLSPVDPALRAARAFALAGTWSTLVQPGEYVVSFVDPNGFEQYAFGAPSPDSATVVTATTGQVLQVDDVLLQGSGNPVADGVVTGRVTDAVTGEPVAGICPAITFAGDPPPQIGSCFETGFSVATAADGTYSIPVGPGDWDLWAVDPTAGYAAARTPVTVVAGETLSVATTLVRAGTVTGRAVDPATGAALAGICPSARVGRTDEFVGLIGCSDASGNWTLKGLSPGQVTVQLGGDATHVDQWVPGVNTQAQATLLSVTAGATVDVGRVPLPQGATLAGRVTDRRGRPVQGAWVVVGGFASRAGAGEGRYTARTGADGRYRITNVALQPDFATVYVPDQPFAWQFSGQATDPVRAERLRFRSARTTTFDARLEPEARLTVTVRNGRPDGFTMLDATTLSGAAVGWSADVLESGTATIGGLPTSRVKLKVTIDDGRTPLWYAGGTSLTADPAAAVAVRVAAGRPVAVTVDLPAAG
ncbi:MAG: hypothetical protein HY830_25900 [Actinobacteria bacterium]|nr:hypothetical protein [Actinomycetota bacterium]